MLTVSGIVSGTMRTAGRICSLPVLSSDWAPAVSSVFAPVGVHPRVHPRGAGAKAGTPRRAREFRSLSHITPGGADPSKTVISKTNRSVVFRCVCMCEGKWGGVGRGGRVSLFEAIFFCLVSFGLNLSCVRGLLIWSQRCLDGWAMWGQNNGDRQSG